MAEAGAPGEWHDRSGTTWFPRIGVDAADKARLESLLRGARELGVELSEEKADRLGLYADIISRWNERIRLVADAEPEVLVRRHLLDSLSCLRAGRIHERSTLVDVGTGAGLPGIPLAIATGCAVTLVESSEKKALFLEEACRVLDLPQVSVLRGRAEGVGQGEQREQFDCATVRAVDALPVVMEYCVPLVRVGGYVVAQKGAPDEAELRAGREAAALLGAGEIEVVAVGARELLGGERCLVVCRKDRATPARFPRSAGIPRKRPLPAGDS